MQFVADGPEIPEALLQAHEEGRVVFFCGAGISYPANLPGFAGLVERIYKKLGASPTPIEEAACKRLHWDAALDLLERRVPGQRFAVRKALAQSLRPNLKRPGATQTHQSLLQLSRHKDGSFRLVTTNFDRIFEKAARELGLKVPEYHAPLLPIPKRSRWSGLVYLHGILPPGLDQANLNRLIVTSGDFGLAYLTERWASRFVTDLFCNYVVCFVGYTINDPVLRYMMDALAADRMLGENTPQAYAFGAYSGSAFDAEHGEWEAKGVTPILYEVPEGTQDHSALHQTLAAWAQTYRDGVTGKEHIVAKYASTVPSGSTRQDDFVGRLLWAVADPSGLAAKRFAEHDPTPSLEWLKPFGELRFGHSDLRRFGVPPFEEVDDNLQFSLIRRPAPYTHAPQLALTWWSLGSAWDGVMRNLAKWLLRHLDDPALAMWLMTQGSALHPTFAELVDKELQRLSASSLPAKADHRTEAEGKSEQPSLRPGMRLFWRLLVADRLKFGVLQLNFYDWIARFKREGLNAPLRLALREHLSPRIRVRLRTAFVGDEPPSRPTEFSKMFDWELVLANDHVQSALDQIEDAQVWADSLPKLLNDFQQLLQDACDLSDEARGPDQADRSYLDLPSISPHWQNREHDDWTVLIELVRDSWLATLKVDAARALALLSHWFSLPNATFKRLALFGADAASPHGVVDWVSWLLAEDRKWLWSIQTRREVLRLFVLQGMQLSPNDAARLEHAIIRGPGLHHRNISDTEERKRSIDGAVWLRLAKLYSSRRQFETKGALRKFDHLSKVHPSWALAQDESDEFAIWSAGTGDPGFNDRREFHAAPREKNALAQWIRSIPREKGFFYEDDWAEICRTRFAVAFGALLALSREGEWPVEQWREALQVWSSGRLQRTAKPVAFLVQQMPDDSFAEVARAVAWWLDAVTRSEERCSPELASLADRVIQLDHSEVGEQTVFAAINHPIGLATSALLNIWFASKPNDGDRLPKGLRDTFNRLADTSIAAYRHGRLIMASRTIALFRVDQEWAVGALLPLFDWSNNRKEALGVWQGFLWSPRLYAPVLRALKVPFLETSRHDEELGDYDRQYAALLTYCALESVEGFGSGDFRSALENLPPQALVVVARTLGEAVAAAGDRRADYWKNRVRPFWVSCWPKHARLASPEISEALAIAAIGGGDQLPQMLQEFNDWLRPSQYPHYILHRLMEARAAELFPGAVLQLLDRIIENQPHPGGELSQILDVIAADPEWAQDERLQRLYTYLRRLGH